MQIGKRAQVRVRAVYPHCLFLFDLPADTCKADLASLVESFGERHGRLLRVEAILPPRRDRVFLWGQ